MALNKRHITLLALCTLLSCAVFAKKAPKVTTKSQAEIQQEQEKKYFFYEAMRCFDANDFGEAMALLQHCESIDPNDAGTAYYLSILYGGLGDKQRNTAYVEKAYALCPSEYWRPFAYQVFSITNRRREAIKAVESELKRHPDNSEAAELLRNMHQAMNNYKGALKAQDLLDKANGSMDVYSAMQRFQIYREAGNAKKGMQVLEDYLKKEPAEHYVQVFLADTYMALGDSAEAHRRYEDIEKHYPENPYLPYSFSAFYSEQGDTTKAIDYLWRIIENDEMSAEYKLGIVNANACLHSNDSVLQNAYETLAKEYPLDEKILEALAQYYFGKEMSNQAKHAYEALLALNQDNTPAWTNLLLLASDDSTATFAYKDSLIREVKSRLKEEDVRTRFVVYSIQSNIYMKEAGNDSTKRALVDTAFTCMEAALRIDPENLMLLNNYAYFLAIHGGDLRKAEKMSQRTIQKEPRNATYLDTYAWILHLEGQDTLARFYMQQAWNYTTDKNDPDLLEHYKVLIGEPK